MKSHRGRIVLVDDDPGLLRLLSLRLERESYEVRTAETAREALQLIAEFSPGLVISDLRMDEMDGSALLDAIQLRWPGLAVLLVTAHGTIPDAVDATMRGAVGFLTKPVDKHELLGHIERALAISPGVSRSSAWRREIIGQSAALESVLAQAERVAKHKASILISGPSGSGKEILARAIHGASARKGRFVALNSAAMPAELIESELFGHERGAFTGAARERDGLFKSADGGTLFLDEIGDMPAPLQVKLLRVLQEGEIRPVGGNRDVTVDVRIISATHQQLDERIASGLFREDLYYRLKVVELVLPPLAARPVDIPLLAIHFLNALNANCAANKVFAPKSMELLIAAKWPGNIRELSNVIERAHALTAGNVIGARTVRDALGDEETQIVPFKRAREEFTRQYLCQLLATCQGNVSAASRMAERDRSDFYKLLARHAIDPKDYKNLS